MHTDPGLNSAEVKKERKGGVVSPANWLCPLFSCEYTECKW